MIKTPSRFVIVGLGLMGGSYAQGLHRAGHHVAAIDQNRESLDWALKHEIIDEGVTESEAAIPLRCADYVIVALYPGDILPWLRAHKEYLLPGALITDLCGVKGSFVEQAQALLAPEFEFIPSHPMAGREVSGVQHADDSMFRHANFLITPTARNTARGVAFARELAALLGFSQITELDVAQHDEMIGYVSQLTHAIAVSLMNANSDPRLPQVTGDSFRDLTRIADINGALWSELFLGNAPALLRQIDVFSGCLGELRRRLEEGDRKGLEQLFEKSRARRQEFRRGEPR